MERRHEQAVTVEPDQSASEQRGPIVRRFKTRSADQRNENADEGRRRSQRVTAMVPGVRFQNDAVERCAGFRDAAKETLLHQNDRHEND